MMTDGLIEDDRFEGPSENDRTGRSPEVRSSNTDIDRLHSDMSKLSLDSDHQKSGDQVHGHVTRDLENGETDGVMNRQESVDQIPSDNGFFDLLPVRKIYFHVFYSVF